MHSPLPPFSAWAGPKSASLVLVGEAWGEGEEQTRQPFVGETGKELWRMAGEAAPDLFPELHAKAQEMHRYEYAWVRERGQWLEAASVAFTNVLNLRPPANKIPALCLSKKELPIDYPEEFSTRPITRSPRHLYLRPEYLPELGRLHEELLGCRSAGGGNLVVALGNTACWALLRSLNIGNIRGAVAQGVGPFAPFKVLPTYHPASVLYQWSQRPVVCQDLVKAFRERDFPEIRRPARQVLVNPSIKEIESWTNETLRQNVALLSVDTETSFGQIKCIGFARSRDNALVVPFIDTSKPGWHFWDSPYDERVAWSFVRTLLQSDIPKLFQNGLYDLQYIRGARINPRNCQEDTMLLHHSLFPEVRKSLGFLGSIYTNEASWKLMNRQEKKVRRVRAGLLVKAHAGEKRDG